MGVVTTQAVVGVFDREGRFYDPQQLAESCLTRTVKQFRECYHQGVITIDLVTEGATIFDKVPHPLHFVGIDGSTPVLVHAAAGRDDPARDPSESSSYLRWGGR